MNTNSKYVKIGAVVLAVMIVGGGIFIALQKRAQVTTGLGNPQITQGQNQATNQTAPTTTASQPAAATTIPLDVTEPKDLETVTKAQLAVKGKTAANADVSVNETDVKADKNGSFTANITLDEGENYILVVAVDENGNSSEKELAVTYQTQ